jgi:hypothetical protein
VGEEIFGFACILEFEGWHAKLVFIKKFCVNTLVVK